MLQYMHDGETPRPASRSLAKVMRVLSRLAIGASIPFVGISLATLACVAAGRALPYAVGCACVVAYAICVASVAAAVVLGQVHNARSALPMRLWPYYLALAGLMVALPALSVGLLWLRLLRMLWEWFSVGLAG